MNSAEDASPSGSVSIAGAAGIRRGGWRARGHAGWWAFALHRISGIALAVFLPLHFWALGEALQGDAALDGFLRWTERPLIKASEIVLVFLLAIHLGGGLRLLLVEAMGWRARWQPALIAAAAGFAVACALMFALNLG
jgi:fumarate reductase subunit D